MYTSHHLIQRLDRLYRYVSHIKNYIPTSSGDKNIYDTQDFDHFFFFKKLFSHLRRSIVMSREHIYMWLRMALSNITFNVNCNPRIVPRSPFVLVAPLFLNKSTAVVMSVCPFISISSKCSCNNRDAFA